jgi:WD40 repeat protein
LWNPVSGQQIGDPLTYSGKVSALTFSPDGAQLAVAGTSGLIRLWDPRTRLPIGSPIVADSDWVATLAYSPDGRLLASGGADGFIELWDPATGKRAGSPFVGHQYSVLSVAFSADGARLVSGGEDGTLRLWDVATRQQLGEPLTDHVISPDISPDGVDKVTFSPDGTQLASAAGTDGTVLLWRPVWDADEACALAAPYVTRAQVQSYMPSGMEPACHYAE